MWPFDVLRSPQKQRDPSPDCRPQRAGSSRRAGVTLSLEPLEDRWMPNASLPPAVSPSPQPSFAQAAITLYADGFFRGQGLVNQYVFLIDPIYAYPVSPSALNESIALNSPYAGPFAPLFVVAGVIAGAEVQYQLQIESFKFF